MVVHLANSRRVNHFAAGVLLGYGICLPGFGRWQARTTGVRVLYFMRFNEWGFEINNANKGENLPEKKAHKSQREKVTHYNRKYKNQ